MRNLLFFKIGLTLLLVICLVAPFTFLKPDVVDSSIVDLAENTGVKEKQKKPKKKMKEQPLHDVSLPNFAAIKNTKAKKKAFFDFMKTAVIKHNNLLRATRAKVNNWLEKISLELPLSDAEQQELNALAKQYRVKKGVSTLTKLNELLLRVDVIPMPLVLVQAANESAWGTSRFSRIGLNFFGIWCYRQGCGMVPDGRDTGAKHEVAAFQSLDEAIARYFYNINTNNAYRVFRTIRFELRAQEQALNPEILATGLLPYSERGADYVIDITTMLRQNKQYLNKPLIESKTLAAGD